MATDGGVWVAAGDRPQMKKIGASTHPQLRCASFDTPWNKCFRRKWLATQIMANMIQG